MHAQFNEMWNCVLLPTGKWCPYQNDFMGVQSRGVHFKRNSNKHDYIRKIFKTTTWVSRLWRSGCGLGSRRLWKPRFLLDLHLWQAHLELCRSNRHCHIGNLFTFPFFSSIYRYKHSFSKLNVEHSCFFFCGCRPFVQMNGGIFIKKKCSQSITFLLLIHSQFLW